MGEQSGIFDHTALVMVQLRQKNCIVAPLKGAKSLNVEKRRKQKVRLGGETLSHQNPSQCHKQIFALHNYAIMK